MTNIPEHWRRINEKFVDRGWFDPDTYEPIEPLPKIEEKTSPRLPIDNYSLEQLRLSLRDLGLADNNAILAQLYFNMATRVRNGLFDAGEKEEQFFNLGIKHRDIAKTDINDVSEPLPISEVEYMKLSTLLGKLAIDDSNYETFFARVFIYLQRRAREKNGFKLNDVLDDMENNIIKLLEEKERKEPTK